MNREAKCRTCGKSVVMHTIIELNSCIDQLVAREVREVLKRLFSHEQEADKMGMLLVVGKGYIYHELDKLQDKLNEGEK